MLASTASLEMPLKMEATSENRATMGSVKKIAVSTATPAVKVRPLDCRAAGRRMRRRVPTAVARKVPTASAPPTTATAPWLPMSVPNKVVLSPPALTAKAR